MLPLTVDLASSTAPFEQVRTQLAALVAQGALAPGTRLPTVRQLAADLGLAANTVARAYRELEADGVLATYGRRGTFVRSAVVDAVTAADAGGAGSPGTAGDRYGARGAVPDADDGRALGPDAADRARAAAAAYVASVRTLGLGVTEATRLVELAWGHG